MPALSRTFRPTLLLVYVVTAILVTVSCSRIGSGAEQMQVAQAFESWKRAVVDHQTNQALAYIPRHVEDYLVMLNSGSTIPVVIQPGAPGIDSPGVNHLLRTALQLKVPADLRPKLTLDLLLQRMTDKHLFKTSDVAQIALGPVTVSGDRASAQVYYQGSLTALRLPFMKEDQVWKIDVMAILPYAEILMRLDRAVKGETETEQVNRLVARLPSL